MNDQDLVSIIIPTSHSTQYLELCLRAINSQLFQNVEIIIIDNYSNDGTEEIAKKYGAIFFNLRGERAVAKNFGLGKANGKYVLFLDSDMELTKNVIEECVALMNKNHSIGGIIIPERSIGNSFWVKVRDFERSFYRNTPVESARFFLKEAAEKANGYDVHAIFFEESTLPYKISKQDLEVNARVNAPILHHEDTFSLQKHLQKKLYYGLTLSYYTHNYTENTSKQLDFIYRVKIFIYNKRFLQNPFLGLAVFALKFLETSFVLGGFLIFKLSH